MKQKIWRDCPVCGAKDSMTLKTGVNTTFKLKSYPSVRIKGLSEYKCRKCKDAIFTIRSSNKIEAQLTEHKAQCDAQKTLVSEIMLVSKASTLLKMTRQGVLKLMKSGKLAYVYLDNKRFPKRNSVMKYVHG